MDELDRSLESVRKSIERTEKNYFSSAAGLISGLGTAMEIFWKIKRFTGRK